MANRAVPKKDVRHSNSARTITTPPPGLVFLFSATVPLYYYFTSVTVQFHVSNCVAEQDYNTIPLKFILKWIHLAEYFVIVGSVIGEQNCRLCRR